MTVEVALLISFVSVAFSIYFGIKNSKRTDTKDVEERVKESAKMNAMLEMINSTTQEIKSKMNAMGDEIRAHDKRLTIVEESVRYDHERIEDLSKRVEEMEDE